MGTITRRVMLQTLAGQALAVGGLHGQTVRHQPPKPLAPDAVTHDWTSFLGPTHNGVSTETHLSRTLPPPLVWEFEKGDGYTSPSVAGDRLVFFHRVDDREVVECLHPETQEPCWQFRYATAYRDRYGYNNGPRSSPVIDGERVYTLGAEGKLHCFELTTGEGLWSRDLRTEYDVQQDFFGTASTPLAENGLLIVVVGAPGGPCVVAFAGATGREVWRAGEWGPSYASPVPATLHGERRVLVFAGGESNPPAGGLLSIDPADGEVDFAFPFRSRTYESVNASCPVVFGDTVFISASYRTGGALIRVRPDFTPEVVWKTQEFALHFNTANPQGRVFVRVRRTEPGRCLAGLYRRRRRQRGLARGTAVDGDLRAGRPAATSDRRDCPRVVARGRRPLLGDRRARSPAVAGSDTRRLPGGVQDVADGGTRVVDAAGTQPRSALRRAKHTRPADRHSSTPALLRSARIRVRSTMSSHHVGVESEALLTRCEEGAFGEYVTDEQRR